MKQDEMKQLLEKEIPVLNAEIISLFTKLDKQLNLHGADLPIEFSYETKELGHYMPGLNGETEHFCFSLLFIGFAMNNQLSKEERENLYKHEYAHYMTRYIKIPEEYLWQPGPHGSAWKYCCSLIKVRPSKYFSKEGDPLEEGYETHLKKEPVNHKTVQILSGYRAEQEYRNYSGRRISFSVGDTITHPKFGQGKVEKVEQLAGSVRLTISFACGTKEIDQKWVLKNCK